MCLYVCIYIKSIASNAYKSYWSWFWPYTLGRGSKWPSLIQTPPVASQRYDLRKYLLFEIQHGQNRPEINRISLRLVAWHYSHITESFITGFDHCGCLNTEFVSIAERWNHSNIYKCSENQANTYKGRWEYWRIKSSPFNKFNTYYIVDQSQWTHHQWIFNSLWPGRFEWNFIWILSKPITKIDGWDSFC